MTLCSCLPHTVCIYVRMYVGAYIKFAKSGIFETVTELNT